MPDYMILASNRSSLTEHLRGVNEGEGVGQGKSLFCSKYQQTEGIKSSNGLLAPISRGAVCLLNVCPESITK